MLQGFDTPTRPENGPPRLAQLRQVMAEHGLAGFLVPRADAHQGEYVAAHDERLSWLTGFTGSAGFAAITMQDAGVFIDGRYRVQVKDQVDLAHFTPVPWPETKLADWLRENLPEGGVIGFDPMLHTFEQIEQLLKGLDGSDITLSEAPNLVDTIWADQPAPPMGLITPYPETLAGAGHDAKRARIAQVLREAGQSAAVLTLPDSIAWVLNVRGTDIARNPVPHGFAILHDTGRLTLFADPAKADDTLRAHLGSEITLRPPDAFGPALHDLSGTVRVDRNSAPLWVAGQLKEAGIDMAWGEDPCILPKACKNDAEIAGSVEAHLRDGAAMVEFLCWLDATLPHTPLTEIDVVTELESARAATKHLRDISFETIAGTGPNGAIVHYRVTRDTNRNIQNGDLLLIDSGGQYLDGTTDITRTLPVGNVGAEERECFTLVLRGMIAMSRAQWPRGVAGRDLDALARAPLWTTGRDYDHGTGHGVGAYLSVHEGPQRLSRVSTIPLQEGMILSNEPGYYREGAFGIRIENLIVVQKAPPGPDERDMLSFRTLTFVPIDRRLIDVQMLSAPERDWLNAYHQQVYDQISPRVSDAAKAWLGTACAPI